MPRGLDRKHDRNDELMRLWNYELWSTWKLAAHFKISQNRVRAIIEQELKRAKSQSAKYDAALGSQKLRGR